MKRTRSVGAVEHGPDGSVMVVDVFSGAEDSLSHTKKAAIQMLLYSQQQRNFAASKTEKKEIVEEDVKLQEKEPDKEKPKEEHDKQPANTNDKQLQMPYFPPKDRHPYPAPSPIRFPLVASDNPNYDVTELPPGFVFLCLVTPLNSTRYFDSLPNRNRIITPAKWHSRERC